MPTSPGPCPDCPDPAVEQARRRQVLILTALGLIILALAYCAWRIVVTSRWLADHRAYIQARDAAWGPFLAGLRDHMARHEALDGQIEAHLGRQDADAAALRADLAKLKGAVESR